MDVHEVVQEGIALYGSPRELGKALGVSRAAVEKWTTGSFPRSDVFLRLLDLTRSAELKPLTPPASMRILGRVSAGIADIAVENSKEFSGAADVWRSSAYWPLVSGEVAYLEVSGDSMEPKFPNGSLLAVARPATRDLPPLTPVIARIGDRATFKLFRRTQDRRGTPEIELIPINHPTHEIIRASPKEVTVDLIVLGQVTPWRDQVETRRPTVFREPAPPPPPEPTEEEKMESARRTRRMLGKLGL